MEVDLCNREWTLTLFNSGKNRAILLQKLGIVCQKFLIFPLLSSVIIHNALCIALYTYIRYISDSTNLCGEQEVIFILLGKVFSIFIPH